MSGQGQATPPPTLWETLVEDACTYGHDMGEVGLWVTAAHRVRAACERSGPPALRPFVRAAAAVVRVAADWIFGIQLPPEVDLGRRVRIWHHGCVRLAARAIGDDVHLRSNTTLGAVPGVPDEPARWPVIASGVDIGAGAAVLGDVHVGAGAFVGANSLVLADVPAGAVALGVPARLLPGRRSS